VESGAIDLAGRLAELIARLHAAVDALSTPRTVPEWAAALAEAADTLTATAPHEAWQRAELQRLLDDVVNEAAGHAGELEPAEVRALLAERLQGRPTRANFRTGHLTICTLVPMRSVPHRVVCLLGLDDGTFPRKAPRDGDDLMLDEPRVGERDARTEDRQLLLDALMAATDRLIVAYTGHDERTNLARPPAVPVGELLDVVGRDVIVEHPLQPFDPSNFEASDPWSFDRVLLEGAKAMTGEREERPPFLRAPLPAREPGPLELDDLVRFVQHPARAFLRQRLGISVGEWEDEIGDGLPVELDALEQWGVGQRLLDALMLGADGRTAIRAEIARGKLPPGQLGRPVVNEIWQDVDEIAQAARKLIGPAPEPRSVDIKLDLADRRLTGTVPGVRGSLLTNITYSKVNARHRLGAWVRFLALAATGAYEAATIGRARGSAHHHARLTVARLPAMAPEAALERLALLIDLYDRGMREPLPIACRTSAAYAAGANARAEWESDRFPKEDADAEHELIYGQRLPFAKLLATPPEPGELWDPNEESRFGQYAKRLWSGLLAHEVVTDQ
jgi:exodeoxyribonuclease V gamma subunit